MHQRAVIVSAAHAASPFLRTLSQTQADKSKKKSTKSLPSVLSRSHVSSSSTRSCTMPPKRRKGKQASRGLTEEPSPEVTETVAPDVNPHDASEPPREPPLVLTSDKRRGVYECDYCHADISQVPRIRCAKCPDFDLCLDCFASADHAAATAGLRAMQDATNAKGHPNHDDTHGYRVADSTRYVLFPPSRAVVPSRPPSCVDGDEDDRDSRNEGDFAKETEGEDKSEKAEDEKEDQDFVMEETTTENEEDTEEATERAVAKEADKVVVADPEKQDGAEGETEKDSGSVLVVQDDPKFSAWTVEEDLRLLDAIATCGLGNWADIAETISGNGSSSKSPKRCMERYFDDFLGRYGQILPSYTVVECDDEDADDENDGKDADEAAEDATRSSKRRRSSLMRSYSAISVMSQTSGHKKKRVVPTASIPSYHEVWPSSYLPPIPGVHASAEPQLGEDVGRVTRARAEQDYIKELSKAASREEADAIRKEWTEKRLNKLDGPTALPMRSEDIMSLPGSDLAGYMPRRGDFDMEWENDAEAIIADMEFTSNDTQQDRQIKIQIIEIYNAKLDERERRKEFLLSRGLLDYEKNQKSEEQLPRDERDLVRRMRLFERLHTPEEHQQFIADILKAKRLRKEIAKLQMYRRMGITSLAEAEKFELDKSRREFHKHAQLQKDAEAQKSAAAAAAAAAATGGVLGDGLPFQEETESSSYWKQYRTTRVRRSINRVSSDGVTEQQNQAGEAKESVLVGTGALTIADASKQSEPSATPTTADDPESKEDSAQPEKPAEALLSNQGTDRSTDEPAANSSHKTRDPRIVQSPGCELLSSKEVDLCEKLELLPAQYLEVKSTLIQESMKRGLLDKGGSTSKRTIVMIDAEKRGDIVDFMVHAGWISSKVRT